ncbi:MAG: hypothetical protein HYR55_02965 [Acidobacteria bacterium]|nr:hypothetical protein [Acidobacteriota bacterium]MBI3654989.1 hypothetical protein [Acidobacteriota bacterium]
MKKLKIEGPQDVFDIVKRRKWLMCVPFLMITVLVMLVAYNLPNIYQSETMIIVEEQKIPSNMVAPLDNVDTMDRLNTLSQQILSRSNLGTVVNDFNLYSDFRIHLTQDDKILALRNAVRVEPGTSQRETTTKVSYFKLSYESRDRFMAMKVTNRLAQLFMEYDYKARMQKNIQTIAFFTSEAAAVEAMLTEAENKERIFRQANLYALPEQAERNTRMLEIYQAKEKSATEALDRSETRIQNLKRILSETPEYLDSKVTKVIGGETVQEGITERGEDELTAAQRNLAQMRARYTEKHPDVRAAANRVRQLEMTRRDVPGATASATDRRLPAPRSTSLVEVKVNPIYGKLKDQITELESEIQLRRKERETAKTDVATFERYIGATPQAGMELAVITRDLSSLRDRYNKLRNMLNEAKMASNMDARQKGESFRIQDPASLPATPIKPRRIIYILIGALFGLGLGILLAVLREFFDEKIRTRAEIEGPLGLPVLVEIPEILNQRELNLKRMKKVLAFSFSIVLFVGIVGVAVQLFFRNYQIIVEYVILSGLV